MQVKQIVQIAAIAGCLSVPAAAFAAGSGGDSTAPAPKNTQTTQDCLTDRQWDPEANTYVRFSKAVNGVWDPNLKRCIRPDKAGYLKSELLEDAVRELAYAGRYDEAQQVLAQMDQSNDMVQTYWGFTHRKLGDVTKANMFYEQALAQNPNNILARSYMGQGFVAEGDYVGAREQLLEIIARGGEGSWAETSLRSAIETGTTYNY